MVYTQSTNMNSNNNSGGNTSKSMENRNQNPQNHVSESNVKPHQSLKVDNDSSYAADQQGPAHTPQINPLGYVLPGSSPYAVPAPMPFSWPFLSRELLRSNGRINFNQTYAASPSGDDLPLNDKISVRFYYNLGIEYFKLLQQVHGYDAVMGMIEGDNASTAHDQPSNDDGQPNQMVNEFARSNIDSNETETQPPSKPTASKRRCIAENEGQPNAKKEKRGIAPNSNEETDTNPPNTTTIDDIDDNCLENILKYLNPIDLLNVADTNKRLKQESQRRFSAKYGEEFVHLSDITPSQPKSIQEKYDGIQISNLTVCMKFIRCFGHLIHWLIIDYAGAAPNHCAALDGYINEYCAETLIHIEIHHAREGTMDQLKKPFSKVEIVRFVECHLGRQLTDFNKWFPQMEWLDFDIPKEVTDRRFIEKHFPSLYSLGIHIDKEQNNWFGRSNVLEALRLNQQLIHLTIIGDKWDAPFLRKASKHLQNLERLSIYWESDFSNLENGTIHFKNVRRLTIDCNTLKHGKELPKIPLSFDQLNELTIDICDNKMNDNMIDFIGKQLSLAKFTLNVSRKNDDPFKKAISKIKRAQSLPAITLIDVESEFAQDEVIHFLKVCKLLKKFRFQLAKSSDYDSLKEIFPKEWQISMDQDRNVQMKREGEPHS